MNSLHVVIVAGEDFGALERTLANVREQLKQIRVLMLKPIPQEILASLGADLQCLAGEWRDSLADAWTQGLQDLPAGTPVLLLEAGETLSPDAWAGIKQAAPAGQALVSVNRGEICEYAPRLLTPASQLTGAVYPVNTNQPDESQSRYVRAEIDARQPGLWIYQPELRRNWLEQLAPDVQQPDALFALSLLRFQAREDAQALEGFAQLAARTEQDFWTLMGQVMELKTRWELNQRELVFEKLDAYRAARPRIESIPGLWVLRGVIARQLNEADLAMDCFQQARELAQREDFALHNRLLMMPDITWKPTLGLAETQLKEGMFSQAYLNFKQVLEELPGNDYVQTELLKASFFIRRHDTLQSLLAKENALRGISSGARSMLEQILALNAQAEGTDIDNLIDQIKREASSYSSDPFLVSVMLEYAIALLHRGFYLQARSMLGELGNLLPDQPVIWHNLGFSHFACQEYPEAEVYYRKALSIDSRFHDSRFDLAKVLVMQSRRQEALEELYDLRSRQPHDKRVKQAILQLEPAEIDVFVPPLMPHQEPAEAMPFVFVFALEPSWENGADIALKAYYQEFVSEDRVILAFACSSENELIASARNWAEERFAPELLPPVALLQEPLPLIPEHSAWVLPWRLSPGKAVVEALEQSGYPVILTGMGLSHAGDMPLPASLMAEASGEQRRFWRESDVAAVANQMRLAVYGDLKANVIPEAEGKSDLMTHTLLNLAVQAPAGRVQLPEGETTRMPGLSVCMIVKNEESMLAECLSSIQDQVAEIIVVDTGSSDRTRDIASACGKVRLFEIPWPDDFAAARNYALEQASQPWILVLDADEYVGPDFVSNLSMYLSGPQQPDAYAFPVLAINSDGSLDADHSLSCVPRLFPNDPAYRFRGRIHEMVYHQDHTRMRYFFMKQLPIYHKGYRPEILVSKQKRLRDTALIEQMLEQEHNKPETLRLYLILAGLYEQESLEKALNCLEEGLQKVTEDPQIQVMLNRGRLRLLNQMGHYQALLDAAAPVPDDPYVAVYRAQALHRLDRQTEALQTARLALHLAETQALRPDPLETSLERNDLLRDLARLCEETGDLEQAVYYFKRFLKLSPSEENQRIYQNLTARLEA